MSAVAAPSTPRTAAERSPWRAVALPSEHGGWGLTAEPILLGLLVAFSWPGVALGVAAVLAFLVRTPLKIALGDLRRGRRLDRTRLAARIATGELVAIAALGTIVLVGAGASWLWPIVVAAPFVAVELAYDIRSRGRRLIPEVSGSIGITAVAAVLVLAGDGGVGLAVAAWLILAGRAVATIPFVRTQIFRLRRGSAPLGGAITAQAVGLAIVTAAAIVEPDVLAGAVAVAVLVAIQLVWLRRRVPPAKILGMRQMGLGFAVVAATAIGVLVGG